MQHPPKGVNLSGFRTEGRLALEFCASGCLFSFAACVGFVRVQLEPAQNMSQQTALYQAHVDAGAKIVDFAGWDMPVHYGSQIEEHHFIRTAAGMFDVSHMVVVDLKGERVKEFLQFLLANDVAKLTVTGKALYSCMLNESGGVIDDLIVYYFSETFFRMVVNAGTAEKDLAWINQHALSFNVEVVERSDLSMIAVQGPEARERFFSIMNESDRSISESLKPFQGKRAGQYFVARTGYTGEDGFEVIVDNEEVESLWKSLLEAGVKPCGLGARDTLRLEAGMNLYGNDMDETVSPLEAGLDWTVAMQPEDRKFIGRDVLEKQLSKGGLMQFVGLVLEGRGVLRSHLPVYVGDAKGETTSGTFSPTMQKAIAMARIPATDSESCEVEIRGKRLAAKIVKMPFVRKGKVLVK